MLVSFAHEAYPALLKTPGCKKQEDQKLESVLYTQPLLFLFEGEASCSNHDYN